MQEHGSSVDRVWHVEHGLCFGEVRSVRFFKDREVGQLERRLRNGILHNG